MQETREKLNRNGYVWSNICLPYVAFYVELSYGEEITEWLGWVFQDASPSWMTIKL